MLGALVAELEKIYGYVVAGTCNGIIERMMQILKERGHKMFDKFADEDVENNGYKKEYEEFWKEIVERNGRLNKEQVKKELYDYSILLQEVPKVYYHLTGGRISKPNTLANEVISEAEHIMSEEINEVIKEYEENNS